MQKAKKAAHDCKKGMYDHLISHVQNEDAGLKKTRLGPRKGQVGQKKTATAAQNESKQNLFQKMNIFRSSHFFNFFFNFGGAR
jgi:hypothetical protein